MKKFFVVVILLLLSSTVHAQTSTIAEAHRRLSNIEVLADIHQLNHGFLQTSVTVLEGLMRHKKDARVIAAALDHASADLLSYKLSKATCLQASKSLGTFLQSARLEDIDKQGEYVRIIERATAVIREMSALDDDIPDMVNAMSAALAIVQRSEPQKKSRKK